MGGGVWTAVGGLVLLLAGCTLTPAPTAAGGFSNPVYAANFPDPMIISTGDGYLAVGTNDHDHHVQSLSSRDLISWAPGPDLLPRLPDWTTPGDVWAPEIAPGPRGGFLLYYTTRVARLDRQCIGVATAATVDGPYADTRSGPLVCQRDQGGSIDPHPFAAADGRRYLYWKNDGNAVGGESSIWVQRLGPDGTSLLGDAKAVLTADEDWEGGLVEAPYVVEDAGRLHLFYSANAYASSEYGVGHAVGDDPMGPFTKTPGPVLAGNTVAGGPGHCALVRRGDRLLMAYHAWPPEGIGQDEPGRTLWLSQVQIAPDGTVAVEPPAREHTWRP